MHVLFIKLYIPDVLNLPLSPFLNFTGLLLHPACPIFNTRGGCDVTFGKSRMFVSNANTMK